MAKRRSFEVEGLKHENPIPMGCIIGPFMMSSGIFGMEPVTRQTPPDIEGQCKLMFENIRRVMEAAGGTVEDIIKMVVWAKDKAFKEAVNVEWNKMFPDEHSRPARHTMLYQSFSGNVLIQCEIVAVLGVSPIKPVRAGKKPTRLQLMAQTHEWRKTDWLEPATPGKKLAEVTESLIGDERRMVEFLIDEMGNEPTLRNDAKKVAETKIKFPSFLKTLNSHLLPRGFELLSRQIRGEHYLQLWEVRLRKRTKKSGYRRRRS